MFGVGECSILGIDFGYLWIDMEWDVEGFEIELMCVDEYIDSYLWYVVEFVW